MKVKDFVDKLKHIAKLPTVYLYGGIGSWLTEQVVEDKIHQYPDLNGYDRSHTLYNKIGKCFGFDCVCLIKSILWGWNGQKTALYGGAVYKSNGIPDIDADTMIDVCRNVSSDFRNIKVGSAVWMPGHIGVFVGNGKVVECTPSWDDGVQVTDCYNVLGNTGKPGRYWEAHGLLPYVDYSIPTPVQKPKPKEQTVSPWAKKEWDWCVKNEIIDGSNPKTPATREQVAVMMYRLYHNKI